MEKEKEVDIEGKKYVIRKLTFGQMNKLANLISRNTPEHPCMDEIIENTVLFGLKSAPFQITIDAIRDLDIETGYKLFKEISDFNQPLDDLKKILYAEPSFTEQDTRNG